MTQCCQCSSKYNHVETIRQCRHCFCWECLVNNLKDLKTPKVKCFVNGCRSDLPDKIIRKCLTNHQLNEFDKLCMSSFTSNVFKCLTMDCPYFVVYEDFALQFKCEICESPNCFTCKRQHYGTDCGGDTYDEIAVEARARQTLKQRNRAEYAALQKEYSLIPNPNSFECHICSEFILPRKGVILRNCLHNVCKDCLRYFMKSIKYISHMTCMVYECKAPLDPIEILTINGEINLTKMMISEASSRFFLCREEGCTGMWDATNTDGSYQCHVCHQNNCIACNDIHDGKSCTEFRRTKRYIDVQGGANILTNNLRVNCFICQHQLIQLGGSSDVRCFRCGNHICIFTGKMVGRHDPQKCYCQGAVGCTKLGYFCECTPSKPCHKDCLYGCIPE